ncbi:MAG: sulfotransferase [Deltaproteobacteria bacterium]|nr:sulfotransferase [Deltaproteobacteria bacterium]
MTSDAVRGNRAAPGSLRVIYIAGARNCGSTLLDAILGNAPGAHSLGEVAGFHRYGPTLPCACQRSPSDCAPCVGVVRSVEDAGTWPAFQRLSRWPLKERSLHWMVVGTNARRRYAQVADLVFASVAATTGCRVLIDSSKNATRAAALTRDSRHDVRVVHLVRDGRGYLRSRRTRAAADGKRHIAAVAMMGWLTKNVLIGSVLGSRLDADHYLVCRYEDLMSSPGPTLERICAFAGLDSAGLLEATTTGDGVQRGHVFEPRRKVDYRWVRLDPSRLKSQRETTSRNLVFWTLGGFASQRWGYDRKQSYLDGARTDAAGGGQLPTDLDVSAPIARS